MQYIEHCVCSALPPKLLGIYEKELSPVVERLIDRQFSRVIDIGTAEGYYAVGLARRLPNASVTGFEADALGRDLLADLAIRNGVRERLEIRGICLPTDLLQLLDVASEPVLVICDVEGAEREILLSSPPSRFANVTLVVETHEFVVEGITGQLEAHFASTHRVERIDSVDRSSRDIPESVRSVLWDRWTTKLLFEFRPCPMSWLVIEPMAEATRDALRE
jgi:hypothetical protein